jgi:hypothetical protein
VLLATTAICSFRRRSGQKLDCIEKADSVEMLNKRDDVAAGRATAIEKLFFGVDRKAISAAASRARPAAIDTAAQLDPAFCELVLDWNRAGYAEHIGQLAHGERSRTRPAITVFLIKVKNAHGLAPGHALM